MKFKVPAIKDLQFATDLLNLISNSLGELFTQYGEVPDKIVFTGVLGREIFDYVEERKWQMDRFRPIWNMDRLEKIIIAYSEPITQITGDSGATLDEPLNGKTVKGIVGPEVMQKVMNAYVTPQFKIEKKISPSIAITLHR